jgi:Na+/H+-dicarboxylate symporter
MARLSLTTRVLLALVAGLGLGVLIATAGSPTLLTVGRALEPLGTLFVNGIRMTIIPLVVSSLIVGIAAAPDAATIGRLGGRALLFMVISVAAAAALGVTVAGPLFDAFPIDPAATAALRTSAAGASETAAQSAKAVPGFAQWLTELVPVNPVKAAADGAMLPLIVFSVAFGIAVTRLDPARRAALVPVLEAIQEASLTLVRWVLQFAPLGVFGLAVPLAAKLGVSAVGALATYVGVVSVLSIVLILLLYPVAAGLGRLSLIAFARAALPPQAMAFSGRSSLAAMPAMITATRDTLRLPPQIPGFLVPLLTSTFRVGAGIGQTVAVVFVAHLYGVALTPAQLATVAITTVVSSFSVPGIPGGTIVGMIPVLMAAGVPVEGAGILLGVDTIPDMFRTTANVTGDMAAAVVLGRGETVQRDN